MTTTNINKILHHINAFRKGKFLEALYGKAALPLRTEIAAQLLGRKVISSDKAAQYGNLRTALLAQVGATGNCKADEDANFEQLAEQLIKQTESSKDVASIGLLLSKDDAILAELTPEQVQSLNDAAKRSSSLVDVEIVEEMIDGTVVSVEPSSLPTRSAPPRGGINPHHPISVLPPGSDFMSNGIVGTLIEMVGADAKVELDGGAVQYWSGTSMVYWLPCKPRSKTVKTIKTETTSSPSTASKPATTSTPTLAKKLIFGFSPCRIVMWMGDRGMSFEQAKRVILHHEATIGDGTIRANLKSAGSGKLGKPAELTKPQADEIMRIAD